MLFRKVWYGPLCVWSADGNMYAILGVAYQVHDLIMSCREHVSSSAVESLGRWSARLQDTAVPIQYLQRSKDSTNAPRHRAGRHKAVWHAPD